MTKFLSSDHFTFGYSRNFCQKEIHKTVPFIQIVQVLNTFNDEQYSILDRAAPRWSYQQDTYFRKLSNKIIPYIL